MKICICTIPIRPYPTDFPPFGSMAIIQALNDVGLPCSFYNLDFHRPDSNEIKNFFSEQEFDVVGISAVVSTAYGYVKYLSDLIKSVSPNTRIICGGNLAASAEILLRQTKVEVCIIGDGEKIVQNLLLDAVEYGWSEEILGKVIGIAFVDSQSKFRFTGFGPKIEASEITWPDFEILEDDGSIEHFVHELSFAGRNEKFMTTTVITTKGCVARCTFCHRFERGYRSKPSDSVLRHVGGLIDKYQVRGLVIGDENFGSNRELTREIAKGFGELNLIWTVAGVRARTISEEDLFFWKQHGCVEVIFGIESGSQKMLDIMQKATNVQTNSNALRAVAKSGLHTTLQFVIGMPGEDDRTIGETINFICQNIDIVKANNSLPSMNISINYAQALPGTPLYEYARENGKIGRSLEEEEQYLLKISDIDAYSSDHFLNLTGLPLLKVLSWRYRMIGEVDAYYLQNVVGVVLTRFELIKSLLSAALNGFKTDPYEEPKFLSSPFLEKVGPRWSSHTQRDGYFNIKSNLYFSLLYYPALKRLSYPAVCVLVALRTKSLNQFSRLIFTHFFAKVTSKISPNDEKLRDVSLRKQVNTKEGYPGESSEMIPLRLGR